MFWGRQESVERLALIFCTFLQTGEYKNFIVSGTTCFVGFLSSNYPIFGNNWVIEQNFEQPA